MRDEKGARKLHGGNCIKIFLLRCAIFIGNTARLGGRKNTNATGDLQNGDNSRRLRTTKAHTNDTDRWREISNQTRIERTDTRAARASRVKSILTITRGKKENLIITPEKGTEVQKRRRGLEQKSNQERRLIVRHRRFAARDEDSDDKERTPKGGYRKRVERGWM